MVAKRILKISVLCIVMLMAAAAAHAVKLNEMMSSNVVTILDENGDPSDWIELYNDGNATFNLSGYYLTDTPSKPTQWMFPERLLAPHAYLLVWASGKDRHNSTGPLHTNFSIKAGGEPVILMAPDGVTQVDAFPAVVLTADQSYGRLPDGSANLTILPAPSPGADNSVIPPPPAPLFSKPAGFYTSGFNLTITAWPNTTIYYTLDGSKPTNASPVYTGPIPIVNATGNPNVVSMVNTTSPKWVPPVGQVMKAKVVRAFVVSGNLSSPVTSATYFLDGNFTMPVLSITTDSAILFDYNTGIYTMGVYWDNASSWTGTPDFHPANYENEGDAWERPVHLEVFETNGSRVANQDIGLRVSGQGSRSRPQKSMKLYARAEYGAGSINYPLFPDQNFTSYKRVSIRNSDDDERATYLRDVLAHKLVAGTPLEMEPYRPSVVFLNGEYWGFYPMRDRASQFYLAARYGVDKDNVVILNDNAVIDEGSLGDEQPFLDMAEYVRTHDMRDPANYAYVQTLMDTEDFARYYVVNTYVADTDWIDRNLVYWRLKTNGTNLSAPFGQDGRWRWIMHDDDWSFGFQPGTGANTNMFDFIQTKTWGSTLWNGLSKNEQFRNNFVTLSADQLMTNFAPDTVISTLNSLVDGVAPEIQRQIDRWTNIPDVATWQQNLEQIRQFARDRPAYHRSHIAQYFGLGGVASLTVETTGSGSVQIGSITPSSYPWSGTEFQDVPVTLRATPAPGETFLGWEGAASGVSPEIKIVLGQDSTVRAVFTPGSLGGNGAPIWVTRKSPATIVNVTQYTNPVFLVELADPGATPYQGQWTLDGAAVQTDGLNYSLGAASVGAHRLVLTMTAGATTITQVWNITVTQNLQFQCYTRVQDLPLTCTGGSITGDTGGGCRQVTCSGASGSVTAMACNKPGDTNPTYYEMYRTAASGTPPKVCLGTTCIQINGYVHSNLPACIVVGNGTNATNATANYSLTVTSAPAGQLSINGTGYGTTPQIVSLRPGQYVVSVSASGYVTNTTTIILSANTTLSLTLSPVSNATGNCSSRVNDLPATCAGGSITQDVKGSCRSIICTAGGNSLSVLACNKPGDYNPQYFEMYKQGQTGSGVSICIATTCISNSGYAKSPNFPICTGPRCGDGIVNQLSEQCDGSAPSGWTCTAACLLQRTTCDMRDTLHEGQTKTYTIRSIDYETTLLLVETSGAMFSVNGENTPLLAPGTGDSLIGGEALWLEQVAVGAIDSTATFCLDGAAPADTTPPVISNGQPSGTLPAGTTSATLSVTTDEAATCGYSTVPGTAYASMTLFTTTGGTSHTAQLSGLADGSAYSRYVKCRDAANNTNSGDYTVSFSIATPPPNGTNATATLSIAPWFPQGRSYVFRCTASGFTPTSYDWLFGDGHKQLGMSADNVYHTYAAAGNYTVGCTARTATQSASATLPITVS